MNLKIQQTELTKLLRLLIDKLEEQGFDEYEIKDDFYWIIPTEEWSVENEKIEPAVGSLYDDWNSLKEVLMGNNPFTYVDVDRISSILRAISENVIQTKS